MKEYNLGTELKLKNRNSVYRLIHRLGCISKQRIVSELGLSLPTVTQNLVELMEEGLIRESGSFGNTGGRRAKGYAVVQDAKVAVGVDINKQHYSAVVLDLQGNLLAKMKEYCVFQDSDSYYEKIGAAVDKVVDESGVCPADVLGVGIAVQGIVSADNRTISYGEILGLTGASLQRIGKNINYPKKLFHDSDMAAFAESWNRIGMEESVYLSLSTNLGGAITQTAGEAKGGNFGKARIEHMTLVPDGKKCYCGQYGCADAYCSTTVLTDVVEDGRLDTFFKLLSEEDKQISAVWDEYLNKLAIAINNTRMMYDCELILGGYLGEYLEKYLDELKRRAYRRNSFDRTGDYIKLGRVKSEPISIGAALQYVDGFISRI